MSRIFPETFKASEKRLKQILPKFVRCLTSKPNNEYDVIVVGGGIVGTASAREFKNRHPTLKMAILEKENDLARHQTGHNSGVIHAGIYYKPGSLKAKLCVEGLRLTYQYCDEKKIPYKKAGKLIVATTEKEVLLLTDLHDRGLKNEVPELKLLKGREEIKKVEPHCEGLEALWSPHTGIIDWALVTQHYGKDFQQLGGEIRLNFEVNGFHESDDPNFPVEITSKDTATVKSKYVLTCGGLHADKLAELSGCARDPRIVPFRGEYLILNPSKRHLVKGNIYPVPDPRFPFLGVHFTPRMDGSMWLGPNAVLAFKREGYRWSDINLSELMDALLYPGFIKMALKYPKAGLREILKSWVPSVQVKELKKYIPVITVEDVSRGPAGVRAQAMDSKGNLVDDFYFDMFKTGGNSKIGSRVLHCRNAPSPGATSSLAIAKMMADKLEQEFEIK
ncbi:L-2-hydroxyglutarate dehydrogenase, mitochondrial [Cylas formicarius]|uniref:L-2-hydroxyglutarate dehydrogenase, mitochondrial n=1 Tax=Cylas formicarius TaxID=197179 RepID=UPI002958A246|nr:L-2-hydroxyglutarate dehydrogenase, mitochondrial [Cylas formicarius]